MKIIFKNGENILHRNFKIFLLYLHLKNEKERVIKETNERRVRCYSTRWKLIFSMINSELGISHELLTRVYRFQYATSIHAFLRCMLHSWRLSSEI